MLSVTRFECYPPSRVKQCFLRESPQPVHLFLAISASTYFPCRSQFLRCSSRICLFDRPASRFRARPRSPEASSEMSGEGAGQHRLAQWRYQRLTGNPGRQNPRSPSLDRQSCLPRKRTVVGVLSAVKSDTLVNLCRNGRHTVRNQGFF